ncbi:HDIG domain-containing protein [Desulfatibacillum alkenivorans DSM 16219]|jgi:putative nucleotidyltransferase with HDIG domain|uniref:Probable chemoreceptor glutamine deamidase CheD n=1 Tax=Desulfatibacillum alkenivorans DSM 16219 TaxID=1121393 RepID=A0A1M6X4S7_9BACT|nr:HDOD domain-containing protein [Desulfatibacillum alkenivorans]SHL00924.1 HDIG domain-containing protein [Desulfatibacillum alkenivorans DSM 16219]
MMKQMFLGTEYVDSGCYAISGRRKAVLQAVLGTCVGVVIRDREAGIGGLCHLLLPEPAGTSEAWPKERYAATGLPLFLADLEAHGASKKRMEAFVAGGALVGPISNLDLELDVGGRTADKVFEILAREGIPVVRSETGGYFTCNLRLDLSAMEPEIIPPEDLIPATDMELKKPTEEELNSLISRVRPIPQIALKITRMIQDEQSDLKDLAQEIRQDQVIAAKVLNLCNSAFIGLGRKVRSIDEAILVLGDKTLLQIAVSAYVEIFYSTHNHDGYSLCKGGLFHHAIGMARLCERLARKLKVVPPEVAYTAGLLHDIGRAALDQYVCKAFPLFYRRTQVGEESLTEAEQDLIGISHTEAGRRLADAWELPNILKAAICCHHNPSQAQKGKTMACLVYVSEVLMSRFNTGLELENMSPAHMESSMKTLGLGPHMLPKMAELVPAYISLGPGALMTDR